jgi:hypothetical protein
MDPRSVRTWRELRWIDKSIPGGGGKPATNTPGTFEQALAVARARGPRRRSQRDIGLTLFLDGSDVVPIDEARVATLNVIDDTLGFIQRVSGRRQLDFETAERGARTLAKSRASTKLTRFAIANINRFFALPDAPAHFGLRSVFHTFLCALANEDLTMVSSAEELSAIDELLVTLGARDRDGYSRFDLPDGSGSLIEVAGFDQRIWNSLSLCYLDNLIATTQMATDSELRWARDAQLVALTWVDLFRESLGGARWRNPFTIASLISRHDPTRAVLLPTLLIVRNQTDYGNDLESGLCEAEKQIPLLQDLQEIRTRLPIALRKRFTIAGVAHLDRLNPASRCGFIEAVHTATRQYLVARPDRRAILEEYARRDLAS